MDGNNDAPPIEPVHRKTVLKNETPAILSESLSTVALFVEKYGWFVVLGVLVSYLIWSKIEPHWKKFKKRHHEKLEQEAIGTLYSDQ